MDTYKWGKHGWIFLHYITINYPIYPTEIDKNNYFIFFDSLKNTLPCDLCKNNYIKHLKKYPLQNALQSRNNLIKWLIDIHNETNKLLNKPILSYSKALKKLDKIDNKNNIYYFLILIIIINYFLFKLKY